MRVLLALLLLAGCDAATAPQPPFAPAAVTAPRFPPPSRPVSAIVTDTWSDEGSREQAGEAALVLRLADVRPGQRVADIGAGSGYYTVRLARAVGPAGEVIGQDIVPRYVRGLAARLKREKLANARALLAAEDDPKLPPAAIDRAFLIHMYHEIAQPYALLWRLHASLRAGALVAVVDADRPTDSHGTPPALLRCEMAAVGYRPAGFHDLGEAGGYLALFAPAARPAPEDIKPCATPRPG